MGTRNLTAVQLGGEYRIAQYGQWDGYPSGQGRTVIDFLSTWDRPLFEEKLMSARFFTDEDFNEINEIIEREGLKSTWTARWPTLSRDHGADILQMVADSPSGILLRNRINFAADSLFCEFAYVIDLDKNTLEIFKGFNKEPLAEDERFFGIKCSDEDDQKRRDEDGYFPVRRMGVYGLDDLPTVEHMESDVYSDSDEVEPQ